MLYIWHLVLPSLEDHINSIAINYHASYSYSNCGRLEETGEGPAVSSCMYVPFLVPDCSRLTDKRIDGTLRVCYYSPEELGQRSLTSMLYQKFHQQLE